jgi:hypothetical protein
LRSSFSSDIKKAVSWEEILSIQGEESYSPGIQSMRCFKEEKSRIIQIMEGHLSPKTTQHVWFLTKAVGSLIAE